MCDILYSIATNFFLVFVEFFFLEIKTSIHSFGIENGIKIVTEQSMENTRKKFHATY